MEIRQGNLVDLMLWKAFAWDTLDCFAGCVCVSVAWRRFLMSLATTSSSNELPYRGASPLRVVTAVSSFWTSR